MADPKCGHPFVRSSDAVEVSSLHTTAATGRLFCAHQHVLSIFVSTNKHEQLQNRERTRMHLFAAACALVLRNIFIKFPDTIKFSRHDQFFKLWFIVACGGYVGQNCTLTQPCHTILSKATFQTLASTRSDQAN
jgi:hypothetical protein